jgi:hypothetical protein
MAVFLGFTASFLPICPGSALYLPANRFFNLHKNVQGIKAQPLFVVSKERQTRLLETIA